MSTTTCETATADPCVDCGTPYGRIRHGYHRPARIKGRCHACYSTYQNHQRGKTRPWAARPCAACGTTGGTIPLGGSTPTRINGKCAECAAVVPRDPPVALAQIEAVKLAAAEVLTERFKLSRKERLPYTPHVTLAVTTRKLRRLVRVYWSISRQLADYRLRWGSVEPRDIPPPEQERMHKLKAKWRRVATAIWGVKP